LYNGHKFCKEKREKIAINNKEMLALRAEVDSASADSLC
jgi:hypothetical protein